MSGKLENALEGFLNKIVQTIPFIPELKDLDERKLAGKHFTYMAMIAMFPQLIGFMIGGKIAVIIGALLSLGSFYLIYDAEKPPIGRRIDWITRSSGWFLPAVMAVINIVRSF